MIGNLLFFFHIFRTSSKSFGLPAKVAWQGCRICGLSVYRNPLSNSLLVGEVSCVFFVWKSSSFLFYFSQRGRQKCLLCVRKTFVRQHFWRDLSRPLLTLSEKFPAFCWKFPGEVLKTALPVSVNTFWRNHFWDEIVFFQSFFGIEQKNCRPLASAFQLSWKNGFLKSLWNFFDEIIKLKIYFSNPFRTWGKTFRFCDINFFGGLSKFHFKGPQTHNEEKTLKKNFLFFPFFPGIYESFGLLAKVLWQGCRICSLRVHRNPLIDSVSSGEVSWVFLFGKIPAFCFRFLSGVVKNACTVSVKTFWAKQFYIKYLFFSGPWVKINPPIVESSPANLSKLFSLCP